MLKQDTSQKNMLQAMDYTHIWHPFSQHLDYEDIPPIIIKKAEGIKLYSEESWFYDSISSWWCNIHGHGHPKLQRALHTQFETIDHSIFSGFSHEPAIKLTEKLMALTPNNLTRVFFSDNGSTAIEVAIKQSLQYWTLSGKPSKKKLCFFDGGYHGDTIGAMSVSGTQHFHQHFASLCFDAHALPNPSTVYNPNNEEKSLKATETLFETEHQSIAAILIEPLMMGAGGMLTNSPSFLQKLAALCKHYNVHLICDEIAVGFGRTGDLFVSEALNLDPDFLCLSKALTNGCMPLAVTLSTDLIFDAFSGPYESHTFFHGHTFSGNPLACALANASLDLFDEEKTLSHINQQIPELHKRFYDLCHEHKLFYPRVCGTIMACDLSDINKPNPKIPKRLGKILYQVGLKHHLILRPLGNTLYLYLPLCITKEATHDIFVKLDCALNYFKADYL